MAITYPINIPTYPSGSGIERLRITHLHAVSLLRSPFSFATQTQENAGKMFAAEVTIAPCKRPEAAPWIAFLAKLKGPIGTFYLPVESYAQSPRGAATGTPLVNGSVSARAEQITTKGWTAGVTGILKEGDYIQIGSRLYQVLETVNSDGSGNATLEVFPSVREALTDGTAIVTSAPKGLFRLDASEITTYEADKERLYSIAFTAVEAV